MISDFTIGHERNGGHKLCSSQQRINSLNCCTNLNIFFMIESHLKLFHSLKKKRICRSNSIVNQGKYGISNMLHASYHGYDHS